MKRTLEELESKIKEVLAQDSIIVDSITYTKNSGKDRKSVV